MVNYYDPCVAGDDMPVSDEEGRYVKREDYARLEAALKEIVKGDVFGGFSGSQCADIAQEALTRR